MSQPINKVVVPKLRDDFQAKQPYRYASVGDMFDRNELSVVGREIDEHIKSIPEEKNIYASHRKFKQSSLDLMPPASRGLVAYLNSQEFVDVLQEITGISDLHCDPQLLGGGIHAIGSGGFLKLHTDFNWHPALQMHRRLNLLVYLNEPWDPSWRGSVELWDENVKHRLFSLEPRLGNALVFETNDISYHGHPDPLETPEGIYRKSIAMYYYTPTRPLSDVRLGKSNMTNYVERPGETFTQDKVRHVRHRLQIMIKRLLYSFERRG